MGYTRIQASIHPSGQETEVPQPKQRLPLHIFLFVASFISMMMAGAWWMGKDFLEISNWQYGLTYAILLTTFLSTHEFGHYIAARLHKVDATLPFFIPFPLIFLNPFGTMGALIKTRSAIPSRKALFDIGVSGPLAGFVVCLVILVIGLATLPDASYIYQIHPEYINYVATWGRMPVFGMYFGDTLLFSFLAKLFAPSGGFLPPMNEIYHYPFLCVGWFGMFVTALNLLPIGQLDGGHITYAMFGSRHRYIARIVWWTLLLIGTGAFLSMFYDAIQGDSPDSIYTFFQSIFLPVLGALKSAVPWFFAGWGGWLFWALFTRLFIRLDHPPVPDRNAIGPVRMAIGWLSMLIFVGTVSYNGIYFIEPTPTEQEWLKQNRTQVEFSSVPVQHSTDASLIQRGSMPVEKTHTSEK